MCSCKVVGNAVCYEGQLNATEQFLTHLSLRNVEACAV